MAIFARMCAGWVVHCQFYIKGNLSDLDSSIAPVMQAGRNCDNSIKAEWSDLHMDCNLDTESSVQSSGTSFLGKHFLGGREGGSKR